VYSEYVTASRNAEDARIGSGIIFGSFVVSLLESNQVPRKSSTKDIPQKEKEKNREPFLRKI
jgi:hypothetical protein